MNHSLTAPRQFAQPFDGRAACGAASGGTGQQHAAAAAAAAVAAQVDRVLGACAGPLDVADAGCGTGLQCRLWARRGHRVHGADPDPARLAAARLLSDDIDYTLGAPAALPWPDRSMDLVFAPAQLGASPLWRDGLAELVRVLRPGGVLYLPVAGALSGYGLRAHLARHGLASLAHVAVAGLGPQDRARRAAFALLRALPALRPDASLLAFKAG